MTESPDPIDAWIAELRRQLRYDPFLASRVLKEVADHLSDAASAEQRAGASPQDARRRAVGRFGSPESFAAGLPRYELTLRLASLVVATATIVAAVFIVVAMLRLVPSSESATLPVWLVAAVSFLMYGALTRLCVLRASQGVVESLMALSSAFAAVSGVAIVGHSGYLGRVTGDWDYYVIMFGGVLIAHALTVLLHLYCLKDECLPVNLPGRPGRQNGRLDRS